MRLLAELALIAALIGAAWEKPYHEWLGAAVPMLAKQSAPATARKAIPLRGALPAATPSGGWMWDKEHKTALDRPMPKEAPSFTGHITYQDEEGKTYWIDGQGKRHYQP